LIASLANVGAVNKLLGHSGLEVRVPVLIRHYLGLNGRFIDFSINRRFSDSLDGLILVDLRQAPERYLKRYLGEAGRATFQKNWSLDHVA
jgi:putative hemolysin